MERVIITGGGLVGSLLSMFLARRGYAVAVIAVPVYGRVIHGLDGTTAFQPYGNHGEALSTPSPAPS